MTASSTSLVWCTQAVGEEEDLEITEGVDVDLELRIAPELVRLSTTARGRYDLQYSVIELD
jgi:hypothetical protein